MCMLALASPPHNVLSHMETTLSTYVLSIVKEGVILQSDNSAC